MFDERISRFNCHGNPPPELDRIHQAIAGAVRRSGFLSRKNAKHQVRAISLRELSTPSKKASRGEADDLYRFLLNYSVLIEDDDRTWFDADRALVIQDHADRRQVPPEPVPPDVRIATFRQECLKSVAPKVEERASFVSVLTDARRRLISLCERIEKVLEPSPADTLGKKG